MANSNKKSFSLLDARKELALDAFKSYAPTEYEKYSKNASLSNPIETFLTVLDNDLEETEQSCWILKKYVAAPARKVFNKYSIPGIKINNIVTTLRRIVFFLNNVNLQESDRGVQLRVTNTCGNISCLNIKHIAIAQSKITPAVRVAIAHEYNAGKSISTIANERKLSVSTVERLIEKHGSYANTPVDIQKRKAAPKSKTCFYKDQVLDKLNKRSVMRENGCRVYLGGQHKDLDGGGISYQGKSVKVANFIWETTNGAIPENHIVTHTCGDNMCFALNHLKLEYFNQFGLPEAAVQEIAVSNKTINALAKQFNTYASKIKRIQEFYRNQTNHSVSTTPNPAHIL